MKYTVHSIQPVVLLVPATMDNSDLTVTGNLPGFEIELLPLVGDKTFTLQVTEANWSGAPAEEFFAVGNVVELGFTAVQS